MKDAKAIVALKFALMQEQINFFEYVWDCMHDEEKDFYRNNYQGKLPLKYHQ